MDTVEAIFTRKSVRKFTNQEISEEDEKMILRAGMSGPCCVNARDWYFVVVRDPAKLNAMADVNGRPAEPLRQAKMAVLLCGDLKRAFARAPEYWVIDCAIAGQNMVLAAESLGIGSLWLGTWPQMERVNGQAALFDLPDTIIPHTILAFGYPAEETKAERDLYEEDRIIWK